MFHKDILLLEANEETKLLEAEEADPGTKVSSARDRRLPTFALTTSGVVVLLLLCVVYHNAAKGKNWADDQSDTFVYSAAKGNNWADSISSSKEKNTIVNDQSGTFVYAMTYGPGLCYKKTESVWPGCFYSNEERTGKLTIHGLWPEVRIKENSY
jgi:ribonuclease I